MLKTLGVILCFILIVVFFLVPRKGKMIILLSILGVLFLIFSFPRGGEKVNEGDFLLTAADTPVHTANETFDLSYSFSVAPIDAARPYSLELVLSNSLEGLSDTKKNKEYMIYSGADGLDTGGETRISLNAWGWFPMQPVIVQYKINDVKMQFPRTTFTTGGASFAVLRGENVRITDLRYACKDGYTFCLQKPVGIFLTDYILPYVLPALLFVISMVAICAVSGLIAGGRQGVLPGVIALMLGQIVMDVWTQFPALHASGILRTAFDALTGFMNAIGGKIGCTVAFTPRTGIMDTILLIVLIIVRLIILIYAIGHIEKLSGRSWLAFLAALVLQTVFYAPIAYLQSAVIWLILGFMVCAGAVIIMGGFFQGMIEGGSGVAVDTTGNGGVPAASGAEPGLFDTMFSDSEGRDSYLGEYFNDGGEPVSVYRNANNGDTYTLGDNGSYTPLNNAGEDRFRDPQSGTTYRSRK